jgi:hypothetical protein
MGVIDVMLLSLSSGCSMNWILSPTLARVSRSGEATLFTGAQPSTVIRSCCRVVVTMASMTPSHQAG